MSIQQHHTGRATAYNHQKPYERVAGFIKRSIYACDKNIDGLKDEIKMWGEPEVVSILGEDECYMRREQTEGLLREFESEKERWAKLYEKLGSCKACAGGGWLWQCVSQDESIKVGCPNCDRTGKASAVPVKIESAPQPKGTLAGGILNLVTGRKFR